MKQSEIRDLVVKKLRAGQLPLTIPERVFGGPSSGAECAACDRKIQPGSSEIEAQCDDATTRVYHVLCFSVLTTERDRLASSAPETT